MIWCADRSVARGRLVCRLVGWSVGWSVGWLVGQFDVSVDSGVYAFGVDPGAAAAAAAADQWLNDERMMPSVMCTTPIKIAA